MPTARTLIIPETASVEWREDEFFIIATEKEAAHAFHRSPTDPKRRQLDVLSVTPWGDSPHPVHTAAVGDTWDYMTDCGMSPVYEFIGRFRKIGEFIDPDTNWTNCVIREVLAEASS